MPLHRANQFLGEAAAIARVVEGDVIDRRAPGAQRLGEVPHGREDEGDLLLVMPDVGAFLHRLDQQHHVAVGKIPQAADREMELVAEDET